MMPFQCQTRSTYPRARAVIRFGECGPLGTTSQPRLVVGLRRPRVPATPPTGVTVGR